MTCACCHREITADERTGRTFMGVLCEVCLDKADGCAPREDYEGGNNAIYADDDT